MSDPYPAHTASTARVKNSGRRPAIADKRNLFQRLIEFISPGVDSRDELIEALADAEQIGRAHV